MSPQMVEAVRKEAFAQGWMRARAATIGVRLSDLTDEQLLAMLPLADTAYVEYRAERSAK